ncbi:MAG: hypothetical protein P8Z35_20940 [Ignavibacteriaceae bacterium]
MKNIIPIAVFFTIFLSGLILRVLASKNLLEEYSEERSNIIFNTKDSWSLNKNMFNEKGKRYYVISNSFGILWIVYIIFLIATKSL